MVLPELTALSFLLLTILTTSVSFQWSLSALKRICTCIWSTQTQEKLTKLPLITTVIDIFTEKKSPSRTKVQGVMKMITLLISNHFFAVHISFLAYSITVLIFSSDVHGRLV